MFHRKGGACVCSWSRIDAQRRFVMKELLKKYSDVIPYAVFGVLTTLANIATYWVCSHVFHMGLSAGSIVAWIVAVTFAYLTNRKWVFHSEAVTGKEILREVIAFFAARIATEVIDLVMLNVFAGMMGFDDMIVKVAANVVVIIVNYAASRLVIFRHKKPDGNDE